ncbi:MAG TPA: DUF2292 domain-containing protein [Methylomusa anaerophila]|uniref:DUF2292 domain-containing protein n=1 Tax=Methylomusa anaerophila TaxID=1930071 RepID=A0A348ALF3_9FIRM|nr:DUF2292 domain-containing protein [Methylomusa anaerophila]BBB91901.1 hypothetical protein MAMMFC1_02586 [Methylomusa anaerophila]HML88368.1 DUF2292 domain-containing protein [Methylomusa anaerophila]
MGKIARPKILPPQVMELIGHALHTVQYGYLILTVQDGCVIRMEKTEKYVFSSKNKAGYVKRNVPVGEHLLQSKIIAELQGLMYGQLIIHLEDGKVGLIEKTEKRRINEYEGINGDGI